jgi:hypothetical protein
MVALFPGAMKRLPVTLEEIGIDTGAVAPEPEPVPDLPEVEDEDEPSEPKPRVEADESADETASEPRAPTPSRLSKTRPRARGTRGRRLSGLKHGARRYPWRACQQAPYRRAL